MPENDSNLRPPAEHDLVETRADDASPQPALQPDQMPSRDARPTLDKAAARAFVERWRLVNEAEIDELRQTPVEVKLQQLAALMDSVRQLGWDVDLAAEEQMVRERWNRLRKAHGY